MSHFENPDYVTADGVKVNIHATTHVPEVGWSDPVGHVRLEVQTRAALGSESSTSIPMSVALLLLSKADEIKAMLAAAVKAVADDAAAKAAEAPTAE